MDVERRKYKRVPSSLDVQWTAPAEVGGSQVTNLSINGCFIETRSLSNEDPPHIGQLISFIIALPEGIRMPVTGRVMYKNPPVGFGVLFTPLSVEQQSLIASYISDMVEYFTSGGSSGSATGNSGEDFEAAN